MRHWKNPLKTKLFRYFSMSLLATVLVRAVNLISVPIFSRILTTEEYGTIDVFMTYVNIFMIVLGLDAQGSIGKARLDYKEKTNEYIISSLLITLLFSSGLILLLNIIFPSIQFLFSMDRWSVNLMLIYSYGMFLMAYRSTDYNFNYEYQKNIAMSLSVAVSNLILSIILILFAFRDNHIRGRILGATIPTMICAIFIFFNYVKKGAIRIQKEYASYALKFGVPLIPHNLSHLILANADKVMIKSMIDASASGIYSLAYTLGMMIQVISEGFNQVFAPWLFQMLAKGKECIITQVQKIYILIYSSIAIWVMALAPEISKMIAPKEYWDGISIVIWVIYAVFVNFLYTLFVNIEFFYKKTALISCGTIMAALCNIVLNALFLRHYGYQFGAVSTVISYLLLLLFHMLTVNCIMKQRIVDSGIIIRLSLFMFLLCVLMNALTSYMRIRLLVAMLSSFMIGISIYLLYRKERHLLKDGFEI